MTSLTSTKVHNSDLRMSKAQEPSPPKTGGGGGGRGMVQERLLEKVLRLVRNKFSFKAQ